MAHKKITKAKQEKLDKLIKYMESRLVQFTTEEVMEILLMRHRRLESHAAEIANENLERMHIVIGNSIAQAIHNIQDYLKDEEEPVTEESTEDEKKRLFDKYCRS